MKVKELVQFLQTLDQEYDLAFASYYYSDRDGFSILPEPDLSDCFVRPEDSRYNKWEGTESSYLVDLEGYI
ncbi:MAG: hypothetical protein A3F67_10890 [Verrucomicrobia bacterium RIFCSPHIGHO2_12_FULL_41_10]|nr:MAG: hypothetical protein A3F67_10890 [Verrucomicrobia bacterium RIFCSPHIGHO2_12_FULL_41_10]